MDFLTIKMVRWFSNVSATVSARFKHPTEKLKSIYDDIFLKSCEIFDENPSTLRRKNPLKNTNLNQRNIIRDGVKYLSAKTHSLDYLAYFPLHQNELLYPLRTKYASIVPIKTSPTPGIPLSSTITTLKNLLPPTAKTSFTDIDKSHASLISNEEETSISTLESCLGSDEYVFQSSKELGAAFNFIPPELDSVYRANVRARRKTRNKLPPARSVIKKAKKAKK